MRIDTNNFRGNILSLTSEYVLIFRNRQKFVFSFKSEMEAKKMSVCAMYDIRDTALWTLWGLDSSFCRQMDKEAVSYMLELQDSTGKVIDAVKQGFNKIPRGKEDFSMPLGLLEKHTIRPLALGDEEGTRGSLFPGGNDRPPLVRRVVERDGHLRPGKALVVGRHGEFEQRRAARGVLPGDFVHDAAPVRGRYL